MKVTFTCEKCGHVILQETGREPGDIITVSGKCLNCAKLSWGPFTEDTMAEALRWAWVPPNAAYPTVSATGFRRLARFVLRLLNEVDSAERLGFPFVSGGERDWLLDLAKKP